MGFVRRGRGRVERVRVRVHMKGESRESQCGVHVEGEGRESLCGVHVEGGGG